eukprot:9492160-Alexandrium_andersonii.AAC.1
MSAAGLKSHCPPRTREHAARLQTWFATMQHRAHAVAPRPGAPRYTRNVRRRPQVPLSAAPL